MLDRAFSLSITLTYLSMFARNSRQDRLFRLSSRAQNERRIAHVFRIEAKRVDIVRCPEVDTIYLIGAVGTGKTNIAASVGIDIL